MAREKGSKFGGRMMVDISKLDIFGYCTLLSTCRLEKGKIIMGGIFTKFDRNGNTVKQESCDTTTLFYEDRPITKKEALEIGMVG